MANAANAFKRDDLLKELRVGVLRVVFDKVNGEERSMKCTLDPKFLPKKYLEEKEEETTYHSSNPDILAVWCIDSGKHGWRSFHIDSVKFTELLDY